MHTTPPRLHRARVGWADLLRLLREPGIDAIKAASLCGYEPVDVPASLTLAVPMEVDVALPVDSAPSNTHANAPIERARAFHVGAVSEALPSPESRPEWLGEGEVWHEVPLADTSLRPPEPQALVPRRRMAGFVRKCLRRTMPGREPDLRRCVDLTASGWGWPTRLPLKQVRRWSAQAALIVNGNAEAEVLSSDLVKLVRDTASWSAGAVQVFWLDDRGQLLRATSLNGAPIRWRWCSATRAELDACRHWLWVTAGKLPVDPFWLCRMARTLDRRGSITWLVAGQLQMPRRQLPTGMQWARWDLHAHLHSRRPPASPGAALSEAGLNRLLAAASASVRIEPALLRSLRIELGLSIDAEMALWSHQDVRRFSIACDLEPERIAEWRSRALETLEPLQRQRIVDLVATHHHHLSPLIRAEEAAVACDLAPGSAAAKESTPWLTVARTLYRAPGSAAAKDLAAYMARMGGRRHPGLWLTPGVSEAWVLSHRAQIADGLPLPEGLPVSVVQAVLAGEVDASAPSWHLVQRGKSLWLQPGAAALAIARLTPASGGLIVEQRGVHRWLPWPNGPVRLAMDLAEGGCRVTAGPQCHRVAAVPRPRWASEWARDASGLYALTPPLGALPERVELPVEPADQDATIRRGTALLWQGAPRHRREGVSLQLGVDSTYGVYADLTVRNIVQRMRWITPGEFWMGSLDTERNRIRDESIRSALEDEGPRHRVGLSTGLWLADSTCTEALWYEVMGSRGGGDVESRRPVTRVSYGDVTIFLSALQRLLPRGIKASLPTEAEWEYACRAGSDTAFCWGETSHPSWIQATSSSVAEVGALPPNPWGLYEMHGNVWEWCADAPRRYTAPPSAEALRDPVGSMRAGAGSTDRAVRGGSWHDPMDSARSSARGRAAQNARSDQIGFRLALRVSVAAAPVLKPVVRRPRKETK